MTRLGRNFVRRTLALILFFLDHVIYAKQSYMDISRESRFLSTIGFALEDHVFETIQSVSEIECAQLCLQREKCQSVNYSFDNGRICQLNDETKTKHDSYIKKEGWKYIEKMSCQPKCRNNGTCRTSYTSIKDTSSCLCPNGFMGTFCETEIPGYRKESPAVSCKEIYDIAPSSPSGVYYFKNVTNNIIGTPYQSFCVMNETKSCGVGGWTLAIKINGNKTTFHYNSTYWSNKSPYDLKAGKTGLDTIETKTPAYWSISFTHMCLGMRIGQVTRWIKIANAANSLYDAISSGKYVPLSSSIVADWRNLVPNSSLQTQYTGIGINIKSTLSDRALINSRARIGLLGNNENDLKTPDSRIGFGTGGTGRDEDESNSCGNEASSNLQSDNGGISVKAFCYILIS